MAGALLVSKTFVFETLERTEVRADKRYESQPWDKTPPPPPAARGGRRNGRPVSGGLPPPDRKSLADWPETAPLFDRS
jgi:hypothetical protein